jgi:hypothetical protein
MLRLNRGPFFAPATPDPPLAERLWDAPPVPTLVLTENETGEISRWKTEKLTCGFCLKQYFEIDNIGRWECVHKVDGMDCDVYVRGDHRPVETIFDQSTTRFYSCTSAWREFCNFSNQLGPIVRKKSFFEHVGLSIPGARIGKLDLYTKRLVFEKCGSKDGHAALRMVYRYDIDTANALALLFEEYPKQFKRTHRFVVNYQTCRLRFVRTYEYIGDPSGLL